MSLTTKLLALKMLQQQKSWKTFNKIVNVEIVEDVAATERADFSGKPTQLTLFMGAESKKELLIALPHLHNTDLRLELIDLGLNRGVFILFI